MDAHLYVLHAFNLTICSKRHIIKNPPSRVFAKVDSKASYYYVI